MFGVILVDNKNEMLAELKRIINWEDLGFCIKAEATDGMEALGLINCNNIDLVITEIEIPRLDGIGLLKETRQNNICPCAILLSWQSSFVYARQGLIYGAFDYILKPLKSQELIASLERAFKYLTDKRAEENRIKELLKKLEPNKFISWDITKYYLDHKNNMIRNVCEYVVLNVDTNITLRSISEQFYISTNYFSYLFKEQTGENFQNYLSRVKIERAKHLLKDSNYKAYEVSNMLGYHEPAYFSRLFKKYTGYNPTEYRKNCVKILTQKL